MGEWHKGYKIDGPVTQYQAVVASSVTSGNVMSPAAANAGKFMGVTTEARPTAGMGVDVQKMGQVRVVANGAITQGDRLVIASAAGDVKSVETLIAVGTESPATEYNVVGRAETAAINGQIFFMWIGPETVPLALS